MFYDQQDFVIRFEWGQHGLAALTPGSDAVIIVDVLSFSTCVDIAVRNGAVVYPYRSQDEGAAAYAASVHAELAGSRRAKSRFSLSPVSLLHIQAGTRIVLPSPNGATLSLAAGPARVLAGCLRNAQAVARAASQYGPKIAVIAAGERWQEDGSLRPAFEDLVGAGAIIQALRGSLSPEAAGAAGVFQAVESKLAEYLYQCSSGRELIERGFMEDVRLAAELNVSDCAPTLVEEAFVQAKNL